MKTMFPNVLAITALTAAGSLVPSAFGQAVSFSAPATDASTPTGVRWASTLGYGTPSANHRTATDAAVVLFSSTEPEKVEQLQEDLSIMGLLLEKGIERSLGGDSPPDYRMGIPMLLKNGARPVRGMYLEGYGTLFTLHVGFPLLAPPAKEQKQKEPPTNSEWEEARRQLYGAPSEEQVVWSSYGEGLPFDSKRVEGLKDEILAALTNAKNIRSLKPDEYLAVSVFGTESRQVATKMDPNRRNTVAPSDAKQAAQGISGDSGGGGVQSTTTAVYYNLVQGGAKRFLVAPAGTGRGTVLTIRVRKSDVDEVAAGRRSLEEFKARAVIQAYEGAGSAEGWTRSGVYSTVPADQVSP